MTAMTDKDRIDRLERIVLDLVTALYWQNTDLDGHWGHPRARDEFHRIAVELVGEEQLARFEGQPEMKGHG
jgi:hypothetical protein